jgi:arginase family enzyme
LWKSEVSVDSPEPGGPTADELVELLKPLVSHPLALGLELTIYDPASIRIAGLRSASSVCSKRCS